MQKAKHLQFQWFVRHLATNKKTPGGVITLPLLWHAPAKD
jgi:hypothetical protein